MNKRMVYGLAALVTLVFVMQAYFSYAADSMDEAKTRLNDVRREMSRVKFDYQQETQNITKSYDDKLEEIKKDFHKKRDACLNEKKAKLDGRASDYKSKMKPMVAEEKRLLDVMAPAQGMNFAKPKSDRK